MRFWKPPLALAVAGGGVTALAVTLFVTRGIVDVLVMILVGAALVGMYQLRRYARAELVYRRSAEHHRRPTAAPDETGNPTAVPDPTDKPAPNGPGVVPARARSGATGDLLPRLSAYAEKVTRSAAQL